MVEMKVYGLALDEKANTPVLILKEEQGHRTLPVWIGAMEAMAISLIINKVKLPRPMTHDLLLSMVKIFAAKADKVVITKIEDGVFFAEIHIATRQEIKKIDSRPSDAVAFALCSGCAVFAADDILIETPFYFENDSTPVLKTEEAEKWNELLENFQENSKYKM